MSVETAKTLTRRERETITAQLSELNALSAIQGLIIDHQKADFDMTLEDAAIFAESVIRLHAVAPLSFICVIVSERNRFIIDASVSLAASRGVPIGVYESQDEATQFVARQFPQIDLPSRSRMSGGTVATQTFREAATEINYRMDNSICAADQYSDTLQAIDKLRKSRSRITQISGAKKAFAPGK